MSLQNTFNPTGKEEIIFFSGVDTDKFPMLP